MGGRASSEELVPTTCPESDDDEEHLEKHPKNVVPREGHGHDPKKRRPGSNNHGGAYLSEAIRYSDVLGPIGVLDEKHERVGHTRGSWSCCTGLQGPH